MSEIGNNSLLDLEDDGDFVDPELALQQILEDPEFVQQVTRTQREGIETVSGYFRIQFKAQQQRAILHVPFVPPLSKIPQVDAQATDLSDVRVRVTDRQKFGIRVEVILPRAVNSARQLTVEIIATESN